MLVVPIALASLLGSHAHAAAGKRIPWKPVPAALLRIDDQPIKNWNIYEESKKADPLLLELGNRFLLLEINDRKIFEIAPAAVEHKGDDVLWDPANRPATPLAASTWMVRDVGFAYRIVFLLEAEKHNFDLQLPHPIDLRYLYH